MSTCTSSCARLIGSLGRLPVVVRYSVKTGKIYGGITAGNHVFLAAMCDSYGGTQLHTVSLGIRPVQYLQPTSGYLRSRATTMRLLHSAAALASSSKESNPREVKEEGGREQEQTHGSVLMQVLDKKKQPKSLTVGAKGTGYSPTCLPLCPIPVLSP